MTLRTKRRVALRAVARENYNVLRNAFTVTLRDPVVADNWETALLNAAMAGWIDGVQWLLKNFEMSEPVLNEALFHAGVLDNGLLARVVLKSLVKSPTAGTAMRQAYTWFTEEDPRPDEFIAELKRFY